VLEPAEVTEPRPGPGGVVIDVQFANVAGQGIEVFGKMTRGVAMARQIDSLIPAAARNALSSVVPDLMYERAVLTAGAPGVECMI